MTRKDDLEQRLDDLEDALDPTTGSPIVIVDKDGNWSAGGREVDPENVDPNLVVHLSSQGTTVIDEETLEPTAWIGDQEDRILPKEEEDNA